MSTDLMELASRVEAGEGPDRDLDAEITVALYGWKLCPVPADANDENGCEVLTPDGKPYEGGFTYPVLGKVHKAYHCPAWTRDCRDEAFPRGAIRQQTAATIRARAYLGTGPAVEAAILRKKEGAR